MATTQESALLSLYVYAVINSEENRPKLPTTSAVFPSNTS